MNEQYEFADKITEEQFYSFMQNCLDLQRDMDAIADKQRQEWLTEEGVPILSRDNHTAAIVELAEAIEHIGFKWWKKDECYHNIPPVRARLFLGELIDVFHFLLSELNRFMHTHEGDWNTSSLRSTDDLFRFSRMADTIIHNVNFPAIPSLTYTQEGYIHCIALLQQKILDDRLSAGVTISRYNKIKAIFIEFFNIAVSAFRHLSPNDPKTDHKITYGQAFELIFKYYIGKNALNRLRQDVGYGSKYPKVWNDGREDNLWLDDILYELTLEETTIKTVYSRLYDAYMGVNYV